VYGFCLCELFVTTLTTNRWRKSMKYQNRKISLVGYYWPVVLTVVMLIMAVPGIAAAGGREYTTDADFAEGVLVGVEYEAVPDQLQLSEKHVTLPFIWVPNNNGTVSKVHTETGNELGRYWIQPPNLPIPGNGSPSRTTVDLEGNCWVGNRCAGTVVKIGLYEAGNWIDRNGDSICQTSQDTNGDGDITGDELLPWGEDECVLYEVVLIPGREGTYAPGTYAASPPPTWQPTGGVLIGALRFDGTGHYMVDDDAEVYLNGLDALTVAMWIKSDLTNTDKGFIDCEDPDGGDNIITMRYDAAGSTYGGTNLMKMAVTSTGGEQQLESSSNVQTTEWQHVAMTWSSGEVIKFYINGVEDTLAGRHSGMVGTTTGVTKLIIGKGGKDAGSTGWDGLIDDIRIYNDALNEAAILVVMEGGELELPKIAWNPSPADGTKGVPIDVTLSWLSGEYAASHDVYFGTTSPGTFQGNQTDTTFDPGTLEWNTTYYWQIVEVNEAHPDSPWPGNVWSFTTPREGMGTILREVWLGIGGTSISDLTSSPDYPDNPTFRDELTTFEAPTNWTDYYGTRIHGYLHPETDGSYTFWIASDDASELWLSTDSDPANAVLIANVPGWTSSRQWDKYPAEQQSASIPLIGGNKYYIMALQKEHGGGDNLAVAWEESDWLTREVISGYYLSPYSAIPDDVVMLANSMSEFSGTQGQDNWYYGYYDGDGPAPYSNDDFEELPQYGGGQWYIDGSLYWTFLWDAGGHPNGSVTSGGRQPMEHWVVRRWVSEVTGPITIMGTLAKIQTNAGDGITGYILIDGQVVWSQYIAYNDAAGVTYSIVVDVDMGSLVDFAIAPNTSDWADGTRFTALIFGEDDGVEEPYQSVSSWELLAHWKLDESSGITASDSSGNSNHGTLMGGYDISLYDNDSWSTSPRGLAIDADNNLWAGTWSTMTYYYIRGSDGQILRSVDVSSVNHTAYGAVIDKNGILWSSGQNKNHILRLDPTTNSISVIYPGHYVYGLGVDYLGHLFASGWHDNRLTRINIETDAIEWSETYPELYHSKGVACTGDNDVWVVSQFSGNLYRYANDGGWKATIYVGNGPTGVAVDAAGKVWACNRYDEYIKRIDPATNTVDLEKQIIGSGGHYSYSDMTGIIARTITTRIGTWTVIYDAGEDTPWGTVLWTGDEPVGTSITVKVRSSSDQSTWSAWETAETGMDLQQTPCARYLQIETTLQIFEGDVSPVLYDLTVLPSYAAVTYDGDTLVSTSSAPTATAELIATLRDEGGEPFVIDGIEVTFTLSADSIIDDIVVVAVSEGGVAVAETPPLEPDIYSIDVTVECASASALLVVYNPDGGFATGGGWIVPEDDGLNTHPNARANFGFNAKYKQDSPTGHIEFRYSDGYIDLKSSSIEQLVITGGKIVQFKGWASVNKEQGHWFFVKAIDNGEPGSNDTFDIKVWAPGVSEEGDPTERAGGVLQGGNIIVHTK